LAVHLKWAESKLFCRYVIIAAYNFNSMQESSDIESLPEEARTLLMDKDALMNALQVT